MPWDFALILFFLGAVVPWRGAVRVRQLLAAPQLSSTDRLALYASTMALQWALVALVAWRCYERGLGFEALGVALPHAQLTAAVSVGLVILLSAMQLASLRQLARLPRNEQGFLGEMARKIMPQDAIEALGFAGLTVTVALCEEFLYRGFVFAAIEQATSGSLLQAVVGSAALFAVAHAYQGRRGIIVTFIVGLLFAGVRSWTGSLLAPMAAHLVTDLLAGLLAPRMLRAADAKHSENTII